MTEMVRVEGELNVCDRCQTMKVRQLDVRIFGQTILRRPDGSTSDGVSELMKRCPELNVRVRCRTFKSG
jgi:hypothetical protein